VVTRGFVLCHGTQFANHCCGELNDVEWFEVLPRHLSGRTAVNKENLVVRVNIPVEIRTGHLPEASRWLYVKR
jgi:hypothetical protein